MSTLEKTWEGLCPPIQKWAGGIISGRDFVISGTTVTLQGYGMD